MIITIKIDAAFVSSITDWDKLSIAVLKNMVQLNAYGVIAQTCTIEAELTDEEEIRFKKQQENKEKSK